MLRMLYPPGGEWHVMMWKGDRRLASFVFEWKRDGRDCYETH